MELFESDVEKIASAVHKKMLDTNASFLIPAEEHYNDHKNLRDVLADWHTMRGMFWKTFIGFAIVGTIVTASVGVMFEVFKK